MSTVLGIRFREIGKISYFEYIDTAKENIKIGDVVVAQTKKGVECGTVIVLKEIDSLDFTAQNDEKIIRKASEEDIKSLENKKAEEEKALKICKKKVDEHKLGMKLVEAEYLFDRSKIIFYFVAESRVDFRNLVKDLARTFRTRIELRQVGIRDEAKTLGGLGPCGKPLCCATFLNDFEHVSVKMAKDQGMSLNPVKLSGSCGRLMCCLKYEQDTYREIIGQMPQVGETVITPEGEGMVAGHDALKNELKVALKSSPEATIVRNFKVEDIKTN